MKTAMNRPAMGPFGTKPSNDESREERRWAVGVVILCIALIAAVIAFVNLSLGDGGYWLVP